MTPQQAKVTVVGLVFSGDEDAPASHDRVGSRVGDALFAAVGTSPFSTRRCAANR